MNELWRCREGRGACLVHRKEIAPREEQLMLKSFGDDHRKYMEQTYRLVPGIY